MTLDLLSHLPSTSASAGNSPKGKKAVIRNDDEKRGMNEEHESKGETTEAASVPKTPVIVGSSFDEGFGAVDVKVSERSRRGVGPGITSV